MSRVFLATRNRKKLAELARLLAEHAPGVEVLGIDDVAAYDEPVEDQPTFEGNALLKARAGLAATGLPSLADDSGLCVDALNGMPGVLSARWSGPAPASGPGPAAVPAAVPTQDERNNALLLAQLADVPDERRGAHFTCAVAFCHPGGEVVVHGRMTGHVIREQRGSGGFGYDVLFVADEHSAPEFGPELTSAELDPAAKDAISHRGRALREIAPLVGEVLLEGGAAAT